MAEVKSYSEMRREFYEKYQKTIVPCVQKYEKERKIKLAFACTAATILSILGLFCLLGLFVAKGDSDVIEASLKGTTLFFCLAWGEWYMIKKGFEDKIKEKIMPTVCSCFEHLIWSNKSDYRMQDYVSSYVIPSYTSSSSDDIFRGVHKNINFEVVELELIRGSGKNRTTVFDGVIIKFDMNKDFSSHTLITPDTLLHQAPTSELRHTTLEDVQFEKKFDVFTNDEVEARYLITPTFMERLKAMKTAFKADKIKCAFYGNLLLVALSTKKDLFSLCSLVKPIDDTQQYFQMYEEIVSIVKLIDHFKLDQKIGL